MVASYAPQQSYGAAPSEPTQIIDASFRDLVRTQAAQIGPKIPSWYDLDPKPKPDDIMAEAQSQQQHHRLRLLQSTMMELRIGMEVNAIFERDQDWEEMGEVERFTVPLIRATHKGVISFIEAMNLMFTSRARSAGHKEETATKESYLSEWWADWEERTLRSGIGSLKAALAYDMLVHAMLAVYTAPDPGNERCGVRTRRVDPKCVFPIFEGDRGLSRVYSIYEGDYPTVLGNFGDGPGGSATRKIKKIAKTQHDLIDQTTTHEVIEYYDRRSAVVTWRGEVIRQWEHKLWKVPWVVIPCAWRQPSGTAMSTGILGANGMPGGMRDADGNLLGGTSVQRDIARMYEPFLAPMVPVNDELEMIGSRLFTGIRDAKDPPVVEQRDLADMRRGDLEVKNWSSGVTTLHGQSALNPYPTVPVAENMTPMLEMLKTVLQASVPPQVLNGQSMASQSSGQAIDILTELGFDMWVPFVRLWQAGVAECGHAALSYQRDYAESMPGADGQRGAGFPVPRRSPGEYGRYTPHKLDRAMLERSGCYVETRLTRFSLSGMVGAVASATSLNNLGLGDDRWYIEMLGLPGEPEDLIQRRRKQNMENSPDYANAVMINQLWQEIEAAVDQDDLTTLRYLWPLYKRIVSIQTLKDQMTGMMAGVQSQQGIEAEMQAQQAGMGSGAGLMGPGGFNPTVAMQPGDLGNAVGSEGGAPMLPQGGGL